MSAMGSDPRRPARKLAACVIGCALVLVITAACGIASYLNDGTAQRLRDEVVALNVAKQGVAADSPAGQALAQAQETLRAAADVHDATAAVAIVVLLAVALACLAALSLYMYRAIVRPFMRLEGFAEEVAAGNLDLPLEYERGNPFGAFAWAFDHMRVELKRARESELAAIEGNKTTLAALSHDLRTPVASIRTYAEALEMGLDRTPAERAEYAAVIMRKCDEVAQLVDDLLVHTLADLDRITVECTSVPIAPLLRQAVGEFGASNVALARVDDAIVACDEKRMRQVIENLLANAAKYAEGTKVEVLGCAHPDEGVYRIEVRDWGPGMHAEDIPFAFDRFFRGANAGEQPGVGLGLFVVRHVVESMGGSVHLENAHPGLRVLIRINTA